VCSGGDNGTLMTLILMDNAASLISIFFRQSVNTKTKLKEQSA
jgi:hypothetical protein